jgi:hypothetical protein
MPISEVSTTLTRKNAAGLAWNGIINRQIEEVFSEIRSAGLELHEAYRSTVRAE